MQPAPRAWRAGGRLARGSRILLEGSEQGCREQAVEAGRQRGHAMRDLGGGLARIGRVLSRPSQLLEEPSPLLGDALLELARRLLGGGHLEPETSELLDEPRD